MRVDSPDCSALVCGLANAKPGRSYDVIGPSWRLVCVAVSHDGKQWTKPSLGITEFNHSTSNNSAYTSSMQPILQL